MRINVWLYAACAVLAAIRPSIAQQSCPPDALGVIRTAEIDTTDGPWFGEPHGDRSFLAPGEVVLTFDDGPLPRFTRPILAALAAHCTKASFFLVGEMASEYPDVVKEIAALGHTIGSHTWSHANLKRLTEVNAQVQIESAFAATEKAAGQPIAPFFRYPFLSDSEPVATYLRTRNIAQFAVDIDSFDWRTRSADKVIRNVISGLERRGKGIILFHDIHLSTVGALPELLTQLKVKGYKVVHLKARDPVQTLTAVGPPVKETRHSIPRKIKYRVKRLKNRISLLRTDLLALPDGW